MPKMRKGIQGKLSGQEIKEFYKAVKEGIYQELYFRKVITATQLNLLMNGREINKERIDME